MKVPERWTAESVRRAANALLPDDVWVAATHEMDDRFHARFSATSRSYSYVVGTDNEASSPFRRRYEWHPRWRIDADALHEAAQMIVGEHVFRGFAVRGTAPESDDHRCVVTAASWERRRDVTGRPSTGLDGYVFRVTANRFLHHMVRFLVGTMLDVAAGRRTMASLVALIQAPDNAEVSPPAPPHALFLDRVTYPAELYRTPADVPSDGGTGFAHHLESA